MREIEGMGYKEIAAKLPVPIGTVRSQIIRAREAIQTHLKDVRKNGEREAYRRNAHCFDANPHPTFPRTKGRSPARAPSWGSWVGSGGTSSAC